MACYKLISRVGKTCIIANVVNSSDYETTFNSTLSSSVAQIQSKPNNNQDAASNPNQSHIEESNTLALVPLNFYKFECSLTVTDFIKSFNENKGKHSLNGISCSANESMDSFISDLVCFKLFVWKLNFN